MTTQELLNVLNQENVEILQPQKQGSNSYDKVSKQKLQIQLETNERIKKIHEETKNLTLKQQYDYLSFIKNKADLLYQNKDFDEAMGKYLDAIIGFQQSDY